MNRGPTTARVLAALVAGLILLAGCQSPAVPAGTEICDGIAAEMGGCADDLPTFTGQDCDAVAREWCRMVDTTVLDIIAGSEGVDGEARRLRLKQEVVLLTALAARHLDQTGVRDQCQADRFLDIGEAEFSEELRAQVGGVMFDGEPVVPYEEWRADVARTATSIEND